jgi:hypothetical protein
MKLPVSKGKYVLDKDQIKELYFEIYERGFQNGILVESGVGTDRREEEYAMFIVGQTDTSIKRTRKKTLEPAKFDVPLKDRMVSFQQKIAEYSGEYTSEQLRQFYYYWAEYNEGENKMRFEKMDTFNIELRLKRFRFDNRKNNSHATKSDNKESAIRDFINS